MIDVVREVIVKCKCGSETFKLLESVEVADFMNLRLAYLDTTLRCAECGEVTPDPFTTTIIADDDFSPDADAGQPREKKCPLCDQETIRAEGISTTKGFFDQTEITARVFCANPECDWTLESTARSIHSKEKQEVKT